MIHPSMSGVLGPYVSERQWGTVREDYSADGNAWDYLPHDHARSRAYRWGEDGLAGFCDIHQRLCLSLALWNGRDPIIKERAFGLTGPQGNDGEDVKEYWWYLDGVPSHSWNRWRYHYPQAAYPYQDLIETNARRDRYQPEYELLDTGVFDDDRYWITEVHYTKAGPDDILMTVQLTNAGPEADTVHVLPTVWFRNTWGWGDDEPRPSLRASGPRSVALDHPIVGAMEILAGTGPDGADPELLFCENETNVEKLYGTDPLTPYPKDGVNDRVVHGAPTVNPDGTGTKCAFWYRLTVPAGQTVEVRLRLRPQGSEPLVAADPLGTDFARAVTARRARPMSSIPSSLRPRPAPTRPWCSGRHARACCEASSCSTTTSLAGWTATQGSRCRLSSAPRVGTRNGVISKASTSSRCRTNGSTRGSRRGTSPSTV